MYQCVIERSVVSLNPNRSSTFCKLVTAVVLIMDHVLRSLRKQHPEIVRLFFRQDNAGYYHSAQTTLSVDIMSERSRIQVNDVDFSDPQGGKGSCDRKAAQIKSHVKSYVSEGHSVTNVSKLKP